MTKQRLEELRHKSAPTWEGLDTEGLDEQLKEIDPILTCRWLDDIIDIWREKEKKKNK